MNLNGILFGLEWFNTGHVDPATSGDTGHIGRELRTHLL